MKVLIDSDVCLDLLTARKPHYNHAKILFSRIEDGQIEAVVSAESYSNMFYILTKFYTSEKVLPKFKILRSLTSVGTLSGRIVDQALNSGWKDFEDALQYFCAKTAGCDAIITRNTDDYGQSSLPVFTSYGYLNQ